MTLADEALRFRSRKGPTCETGLLLDRLTEPDKSELQEALGNPRVTARGLSLALFDKGHDLGYWSIQRHRRGDCLCR